MTVVHLEFEDLLAIFQQVPGDPDPYDYGVIFAAIARHRARLLDTDVYESVLLKACALIQELGRMRALEHGNCRFAWDAALGFLALNGQRVSVSGSSAAGLVEDLVRGRTTLPQASAQLGRWCVED